MKIDRTVRAIIGVPGTDGIEFEGLEMEFRILKTPSSEPNNCDLTIHNLNPDSRNKILIKDSVLFLYAGYEGDIGDELIFTGDITYVTNDIVRPEVITKIEAGDGDKKLKDVKLSISYKEGNSIFQIIEKAIDSLGLPVKTKTLLAPLKKIKSNNGKSYMGTAKKLLDIVFAGVGMEWSIQNGEIKFYDKNLTDNSFAVVLTTKTGLIGSPKRIKIKTSEKTDTPDVDGWEFKSLLSPKIEPGGVVFVSSKEIPERSEFKVVRVEHSGNTIDGEFITTIEGVQL